MTDTPKHPTKEHATEADAVAQLALEAARLPEPIDPTLVYAVVLTGADGAEQLAYVDREDVLEEPRRKHGTFRPADVDSFTAYTENHHDEHDTTIWIDRTAATITAVFNDHTPVHAGWGDHKALLTLERTPEWLHWKQADGRLIDQTAFAEHIQQGIDEIIDPEPATMLEIAQSIQGTTEAAWKTARRLDNGEVAFGYTETIQATAGRTTSLEIPSLFTLAVAPFYGEELAQVTARLRYRIREGNLTIGYQLIQPHKVELEALSTIQATLAAKFARVYMGTPAR